MFLVTGATGNVGGEVLRALVDTGEQVRALTHGVPSPALPADVAAVAGDLDDPETLADAFTGVRGVFLLPGYRDMPGVLAEIERAGVEHVVLLSSSSAASGDMSNAMSAYMIASEAAVKNSKVPWTILRSFGLMSNTLRWQAQLQAGDLVREPFANVPVAMIDPYDIAAVTTNALSLGGHESATYALSGPEAVMPADRLRILGDALGRELRLEALSDAEARTQMSAEMPKEYVDAFFDFYVDGTLDESQIQPTVEEILRRRPRTFEQWAAAHTEAFR